MPRKEGRGSPATYRVTLGYDGTAFHGFARQPGLRTVEGVLRDALAACGGGPRALAVGGRTDRGVSATGQVVSFKLAGGVGPATIADAIDGAAPGLWVQDARVVPAWFHAHFAARSRRYVYLAPFDEDVDIARVDRQLLALAGPRRSFHAFARDTPYGQNTRRRLIAATARGCTLDGQPRLRFDLEADSFLRRMVRVLVATVLRTARASAPDDALVTLAEAGDRRLTASPAPAEQLYLVAVRYDPEPVRR